MVLKLTAIRCPVLYAIGCPSFALIKLLAQHLTQPQLHSPHSVLHCPQRLQPISSLLLGYIPICFFPCFLHDDRSLHVSYDLRMIMTKHPFSFM